MAASIYGLIVLLNLARFAWRLWLIRKLRSHCQLTVYEAYTLALSDRISEPFSFWRTIYMNRQFRGREQQQIITHELSHVRHCHTAERLTLELMRCVFWFNPFVWIAGSLLVQVQEWQADRDVINEGYDVYEYRNLIFRQLYGLGSDVDLANGLYGKLTKKRFLMMTNFKKGRLSLLRMSAVVPVMAAMIMAFGAVKAEDNIVYSTPSETMQDVKTMEADYAAADVATVESSTEENLVVERVEQTTAGNGITEVAEVEDVIAETGVEEKSATENVVVEKPVTDNVVTKQDTVKAKQDIRTPIISGGIIPSPKPENRIYLNKGTYNIMGVELVSADSDNINADVEIKVLSDTKMTIKSKGGWKFVESGEYSYLLTNKRLTITGKANKYTFDAKFSGPMFKSMLKVFTPEDSHVSRLDFVGPMETRDSAVMLGFKDGKIYLNGKETSWDELSDVHHFDFKATVVDSENKTLLDILHENTRKPTPKYLVEESAVASVELSDNAKKAADLAANQPRPYIRIKKVDKEYSTLYLEGIEITLPEFQKIMSSGIMSEKTIVFVDQSAIHSIFGGQVLKAITQNNVGYKFGRRLTVIDGKLAQDLSTNKIPYNLLLQDRAVYTELTDEVKTILKQANIPEREFLEGWLVEYKTRSELSIVVNKYATLYNNAGYYDKKRLAEEFAMLKKREYMRPITLYVQEGTPESEVADMKEFLASQDLLSTTTIKPTSTYGLPQMPVIYIDNKLSTEMDLAELQPSEIGVFKIIDKLDYFLKDVLDMATFPEAEFAKRKMLYVKSKVNTTVRNGKIILNDDEISLEEYVKLNKGQYADGKYGVYNKVYKISWYLIESPKTMVHRIGQGGDPAKYKNLARSELSEYAIIYRSFGYNVEVFDAVKKALMDNHRVKYIMIVDHESKGEIICKDIDGETVVLSSWDKKYNMRKPEYSMIKATLHADGTLVVDGERMNLTEFHRYISEMGTFATKIKLEVANNSKKEQLIKVAEEVRDELILNGTVRDVEIIAPNVKSFDSSKIGEYVKDGKIPIGFYTSYGYATEDGSKPDQYKEMAIISAIPIFNFSDFSTLYISKKNNYIKEGKYKYTFSNGVLNMKGEQEYSFPCEVEYDSVKNIVKLKIYMDIEIRGVKLKYVEIRENYGK